MTEDFTKKDYYDSIHDKDQKALADKIFIDLKHRLDAVRKSSYNFNIDYTCKDFIESLAYFVEGVDVIKEPVIHLGENAKLRVYINTTNQNKVREINEFLEFNLLGQELSSIFALDHVVDDPSSTEDEKTFIKIAHEKNASFVNGNKFVLAEDSGVVIKGLPDDLGVRSKRFAAENVSVVESYIKVNYGNDSSLLKRILDNIHNVPYSFNNAIVCHKIKQKLVLRQLFDNKMYFSTGCSIVGNDITISSQGFMYGHFDMNIISKNIEVENVKTTHGFNPLFLVKIYGNVVNYGNVTPKEAAQFSHRSQAIATALVALLEEVFMIN